MLPEGKTETRETTKKKGRVTTSGGRETRTRGVKIYVTGQRQGGRRALGGLNN